MKLSEKRQYLIQSMQTYVKNANKLVADYCEDAIRNPSPQARQIAKEQIAEADARKKMLDDMVSMVWDYFPPRLDEVDLNVSE